MGDSFVVSPDGLIGGMPCVRAGENARHRCMVCNTTRFGSLQKRAYSEKPWVSAKFATTWELPFSGACTFCHVTLQGLIVVGGQCAGKENMHQIRAYDPFVSSCVSCPRTSMTIGLLFGKQTNCPTY